MYQAITHNIEISVVPQFLADQSSPENSYYLWAYKVNILNRGKETVQLRSRFWKIFDAKGQMEEVSGEGVIGEQPILKPGKSFSYTSGCPLKTSSGFMQGFYTMSTMTGDQFEVEIPAFPLDLPDAQPSLH